MSITSSNMSGPSNKEDLVNEIISPENNKSNNKSNSIDCNKTKHMLDADESSTARTEDETDDESLKLGPGFGSLYLTSTSSLSDTATYNSSPMDPTRVRSSSGLMSIDEVVDRVAADREVWRCKSLLVDNDDDHYDDYPSDEEGGNKISLAKTLFTRESTDDVYIEKTASNINDDGRYTFKRTYPASFHCSTKLETNSSFEEPLSCREKFDQPALGCDENLCSPCRRKENEQVGQEEETEENEWVGRLLVSGFYNMLCTPYRR